MRPLGPALCNNYITIIRINNNVVINNNYGTLQVLILLFTIPMGTRKNLFDTLYTLKHAPLTGSSALSQTLNPNLSIPYCNRRINELVKSLTPTVSKPTAGRLASTTSWHPVGFSKTWIHSLARCNSHDLNIPLSRDLTKYSFEISLIYTTTTAWIKEGRKENTQTSNCQNICTAGKAYRSRNWGTHVQYNVITRAYLLVLCTVPHN